MSFVVKLCLVLAILAMMPTGVSAATVEQVHLAYGSDPASQMVVAWASDRSEPMTVAFGLSSSALSMSSPPSKV